jgi:N-glycosylase/DNA lyase
LDYDRRTGHDLQNLLGQINGLAMSALMISLAVIAYRLNEKAENVWVAVKRENHLSRRLLWAMVVQKDNCRREQALTLPCHPLFARYS